jgi:hypothetical protein
MQIGKKGTHHSDYKQNRGPYNSAIHNPAKIRFCFPEFRWKKIDFQQSHLGLPHG